MTKLKNQLLTDQLDSKLVHFQSIKNVALPPEGWIHAVRTALHMSLRQLSTRLGISTRKV
jgi:DNA-binding transcriptional regulator YiaG